MKMDFKKTFQKLLKKSVIILKYAPDVSRFIIQKAMDMRVVTGIYNFLERQNNVTKINIEKSKEFFLSQKEKIEENICLLSDEFSKKTYINMFHYRCTYRNKFVQEIALKSKYQYLDDAINFNMNEVFVDVGAFFGETTNAIYKLMCKKHSKSAVDFTSLIIEPDDFNYKICCKKFSKKSFCVLSENCAVGAYEETAQFSGGLLSIQIFTPFHIITIFDGIFIGTIPCKVPHINRPCNLDDYRVVTKIFAYLSNFFKYP